MVTTSTFTYKPSLVRIDGRNLELSWYDSLGESCFAVYMCIYLWQCHSLCWCGNFTIRGTEQQRGLECIGICVFLLEACSRWDLWILIMQWKSAFDIVLPPISTHGSKQEILPSATTRDFVAMTLIQLTMETRIGLHLLVRAQNYPSIKGILLQIVECVVI